MEGKKVGEEIHVHSDLMTTHCQIYIKQGFGGGVYCGAELIGEREMMEKRKVEKYLAVQITKAIETMRNFKIVKHGILPGRC